MVQPNLFITDTKGTGISVRIIEVSVLVEVGFIWISVSQGTSELSVIERCPYYRGVRKERFHCTFRRSDFTKQQELVSSGVNAKCSCTFAH